MIFKAYCRLYQMILALAAHVLPWRRPILLKGAGSVKKLPEFIAGEQVKNVLLVTDKGIRSLGLADGLMEGLREKGIRFTVFDETIPDPTYDTVEAAVRMYRENGCEGLIAFGGGSPMDCAKAAAARIVRPRTSIKHMRGILRVIKKLPPLYAVPTTAGTGSEATIAAIITDPETHTKYQIDDLVLIPHAAVLDPELTVGLPAAITAATGIDALTHAIEAYLGRSNTNETRELSLSAVHLIFEYLPKAYEDGANLKARSNMLLAAHQAGIAFTRAYVGYVHALAHAAGGLYHVPHGLANAILLPYVLEAYGRPIQGKMAELARAAGLGGQGRSDEENAAAFLAAIKQMNRRMNIPEKMKEIRAEDIPELARRAAKEANPFYPVPVFFGRDKLEEILHLAACESEAHSGAFAKDSVPHAAV